jgi:hypothetical protein
LHKNKQLWQKVFVVQMIKNDIDFK